MAKTYQFRFTAQKAKLDGHFVSVIYGGPDTVLAQETKVMTWDDAKSYLDTFAQAAPGESMCSVTCLDKPVPPGYRNHKCQQYSAGPAAQEA